MTSPGLRLARQRPDCQISIKVLEDLQPRALSVVAEQAVEVFEAGANPAGRDAREVQANTFLEIGEFDAKTLKCRLYRLKLRAHRERFAAGEEPNEVSCLAFESEDL